MPTARASRSSFFCYAAASAALLGALVILVSPPLVHATDPPTSPPTPTEPDPLAAWSLIREPAFNPGAPLLGRVRLVDPDGATVQTWTSPQPNDMFGLSAIVLPDVNGDGIPDAAIAAPNAFDEQAGVRIGAIRIASGADGSTISTLSGTPLDRFGLTLFAAADPATSMVVVTTLVELLDPATNAPYTVRAFTFQSFDAFTGAFLGEALQAPSGFTHQAAIESLATHVRAAGPADLNADGEVGAWDLSILAGNYGAAVDPVTGELLEQTPGLAAAPTGDTNGDGVVNEQDLATVLGSFGQSTDPSFAPVEGVLTEAEAIAIEGAFGQAMPQGLDCVWCAKCDKGWCQVLPGDEMEDDTDLYDEIGGDDDDDGNPGSDGPPGGTDSDGDGIPDSLDFDDDGDGIPDDEEQDCQDGTRSAGCDCEDCSAEIEVLSVERFPKPTSKDDVDFLPIRHQLRLRVSAGSCDAGNAFSTDWDVDAPDGLVPYLARSNGGKDFTFAALSGEGLVRITATIDCQGQTWSDFIEFTVKDYDVVDVRYKAWIPADVLAATFFGTALIAGNGNGANAAPVSTRADFKTWQLGVFDLNPNAVPRVISPIDRAFGESIEYDLASVTRDWTVSVDWAYTFLPGTPIVKARDTLRVHSGNSRVQSTYASIQDQGVHHAGVQVSFFLSAPNPITLPGTPGIDTDSEVRVCQRYTLASGPGDLVINAELYHDGFPSHAMFINRMQLYAYDPVAAGRGPSALTGLGALSVNIPTTPWPHRMSRP